MSRRPTAEPSDSYLTRVVTYIPTEIIAAYVAISGYVKSLPLGQQYLWFVAIAGALLVVTPLWILNAAREPDSRRPLGHAIAAALAFAAWVFASGGPFSHFTWYQPAMGSIVLVLVCLALPTIKNSIDRAVPGAPRPVPST
jgi:phosphoglycerol transferase MdoB-like AlkP superfamily enzyme